MKRYTLADEIMARIEAASESKYITLPKELAWSIVNDLLSKAASNSNAVVLAARPRPA